MLPDIISPMMSKGVARYDELCEGGAVRPHWQPVAREFAALRADEYARRVASSRAMIRDNGITYNVYDEGVGQARPWELDLVPFVISVSDWKALEAAIIQRAHLANLILSDVYGAQRLVSEAHLPPHLVTGHPQYLRELRGVKPPGGVHVHLYSADLARATDGSWMVISSRADAPSGAGYALENRIVVSQSFPDLFRDMQVSRLASFFRTYRENVMRLSATSGRAVLLTPGPYNEAYFEHAYLAHYLGLSLVEGEDLMVRDGQVFLKTLSGLERVGIVFRRVDSDFCDPLEFRADSALGVPGLAQAARTGGVVIANALGSGVVESPAIDAYLPNIAEALLGEELKIPDIPTIWGGTEWGRKEMLARLPHMVVRDSFDARPLFSRNSTAKLGAELSAEQRAILADRLSKRGATFVAQEIASLGAAPVYDGERLVMRPASLRVFAAWTPNGYVVMPGGLARVASDEHARALTMQSGAASKDIWVLSDEPVDNFSLLKPASQPVDIRRAGNEAPSRAMDNLFWLGRYAERAENLVRILRAVVLRLGDDAGISGAATAADLVRRLLVPLARASAAAVDEAAGGDDARLITELQSLIFERKHAKGLQRLLTSVQRTAWSVRDRLSFDTWRAIQTFTSMDMTIDAKGELDVTGARTYLDTLVRRAASLSGLSAENMTRGSNWLFHDLGRRVERASHLAWLVRQTLTSDEPDAERIPLALEIADSAMTYRDRYLNIFQAAPLIDLLLLDDANPRSLAFQLATMAAHIGALPRVAPTQVRMFDKAIVTVMRRRIAAADPSVLATRGASGKREALIALLDSMDETLTRASDAIADAYFQHALSRRTGSAARRGKS